MIVTPAPSSSKGSWWSLGSLTVAGVLEAYRLEQWNKGSINEQGLLRIIHRLLPKMRGDRSKETAQWVERLFSIFASPKTGNIEWSHLTVNLIAIAAGNPDEKLAAIFSMLDSEARGSVYRTELRGLFLSLLGHPVEVEAESQVQRLLRELKPKQPEHATLQEFRGWKGCAAMMEDLAKLTRSLALKLLQVQPEFEDHSQVRGHFKPHMAAMAARGGYQDHEGAGGDHHTAREPYVSASAFHAMVHAQQARISAESAALDEVWGVSGGENRLSGLLGSITGGVPNLTATQLAMERRRQQALPHLSESARESDAFKSMLSKLNKRALRKGPRVAGQLEEVLDRVWTQEGEEMSKQAWSGVGSKLYSMIARDNDCEREAQLVLQQASTRGIRTPKDFKEIVLTVASAAFDRLDKDCVGWVNPVLLRTVASAYGAGEPPEGGADKQEFTAWWVLECLPKTHITLQAKLLRLVSVKNAKPDHHARIMTARVHQALQGVFRLLDEDRSGSLEVSEMREIELRLQGSSSIPHEGDTGAGGAASTGSSGHGGHHRHSELFAMLDPRGSGRVGFEAFSEFIVEAVLASFQALDIDRSGSLDSQELIAAAKALGIPTERAVRLMGKEHSGGVGREGYAIFVIGQCMHGLEGGFTSGLVELLKLGHTTSAAKEEAILVSGPTRRALEELFDRFDMLGRGTVSGREFAKLEPYEALISRGRESSGKGGGLCAGSSGVDLDRFAKILVQVAYASFQQLSTEGPNAVRMVSVDKAKRVARLFEAYESAPPGIITEIKKNQGLSRPHYVEFIFCTCVKDMSKNEIIPTFRRLLERGGGQASSRDLGEVPARVRDILRTLFDELDSDRSGTIEGKELHVLGETLKERWSRQDTDKLLRMLEGERGVVDFVSFRDFFYRLAAKSFDELDRDGSGTLEKRECLEVARSFGVDYKVMMEAMDRDGDGTLERDEYVSFLLGHCMNGVKRGDMKQGVLKLLTMGSKAVQDRDTQRGKSEKEPPTRHTPPSSPTKDGETRRARSSGGAPVDFLLSDSETREVLLQLFEFIDSDGSGSIEAGEMNKVLNALNRHWGKQEAASLMAVLDPTGQNHVEFARFHRFMVMLASSTFTFLQTVDKGTPSPTRATGSASSGSVPIIALKPLCEAFGIPMSTARRVLDQSNDGHVTLPEYVKFVLARCMAGIWHRPGSAQASALVALLARGLHGGAGASNPASSGAAAAAAGGVDVEEVVQGEERSVPKASPTPGQVDQAMVATSNPGSTALTTSSPSLSASELASLRLLFDSIDRDKKGKVNRIEMIQALRKDPTLRGYFGFKENCFQPGSPEHTRFESLIQRMDAHDSNAISWEEFLTASKENGGRHGWADKATPSTARRGAASTQATRKGSPPGGGAIIEDDSFSSPTTAGTMDALLAQRGGANQAIVGETTQDHRERGGAQTAPPVAPAHPASPASLSGSSGGRNCPAGSSSSTSYLAPRIGGPNTAQIGRMFRDLADPAMGGELITQHGPAWQRLEVGLGVAVWRYESSYGLSYESFKTAVQALTELVYAQLTRQTQGGQHGHGAGIGLDVLRSFFDPFGSHISRSLTEHSFRGMTFLSLHELTSLLTETVLGGIKPAHVPNTMVALVRGARGFWEQCGESFGSEGGMSGAQGREFEHWRDTRCNPALASRIEAGLKETFVRLAGHATAPPTIPCDPGALGSLVSDVKDLLTLSGRCDAIGASSVMVAVTPLDFDRWRYLMGMATAISFDLLRSSGRDEIERQDIALLAELWGKDSTLLATEAGWEAGSGGVGVPYEAYASLVLDRCVPELQKGSWLETVHRLVMALVARMTEGDAPFEVDLMEFMQQGPVAQLVDAAAEATSVQASLLRAPGGGAGLRLSRNEVSTLMEHDRLLHQMRQSLGDVSGIARRRAQAAAAEGV